MQALAMALQQLMMTQQTTTTQGAADGDAGASPPGFIVPTVNPGTGKLLAKYIVVDKFGGEQEKWDDWSFAFKSNIRSQNKKVYDALVAAEKSSEDLTEEIDLDLAMEQRSGELYDILCQVCVGEALVLVRSVQDLESEPGKFFGENIIRRLWPEG